jgi:hypothetical protein
MQIIVVNNSLAVLMVWEKDYFCSGNSRFFINDKQKIIAH